jgi:hypothetical protein
MAYHFSIFKFSRGEFFELLSLVSTCPMMRGHQGGTYVEGSNPSGLLFFHFLHGI